METSYSGLSVPRSLTLDIFWLRVSAFFQLLQEETSLMIVEQGSDLGVYQNLTRSHF